MCVPCPICRRVRRYIKSNAARSSDQRWAGLLLSIQVVPPTGICLKCMYAMNQHLRCHYLDDTPMLRGEHALLSFMSARLGNLHHQIRRYRRARRTTGTAICIECGGSPAHRTGSRCKDCSSAHKVAISVKFGRTPKGKKWQRERYFKLSPEKRAALCEYGRRKRREAAEKRVKYCADCNKILGVGNAFMRKTCDECRRARQRAASLRWARRRSFQAQ